MIEDGGGFMSAYIEFQKCKKKLYQMGEVQIEDIKRCGFFHR